MGSRRQRCHVGNGLRWHSTHRVGWNGEVRNLVLVCCLAASCGPEIAAPSVMEVTDLDPKTDQPLLLNDEIRVLFTHALDPSSVTRQSVRLVGGDGQPVEGSWRV